MTLSSKILRKIRKTEKSILKNILFDKIDYICYKFFYCLLIFLEKNNVKSRVRLSHNCYMIIKTNTRKNKCVNIAKKRMFWYVVHGVIHAKIAWNWLNFFKSPESLSFYSRYYKLNFPIFQRHKIFFWVVYGQNSFRIWKFSISKNSTLFFTVSSAIFFFQRTWFHSKTNAKLFTFLFLCLGTDTLSKPCWVYKYSCFQKSIMKVLFWNQLYLYTQHGLNSVSVPEHKNKKVNILVLVFVIFRMRPSTLKKNGSGNCEKKRLIFTETKLSNTKTVLPVHDRDYFSDFWLKIIVLNFSCFSVHSSKI